MDEQRKNAILFAATILAARKLNDPDIKAFGREPPPSLTRAMALETICDRRRER